MPVRLIPEQLLSAAVWVSHNDAWGSGHGTISHLLACNSHLLAAC
jgi:hypothetical protein